MAGFDIGFECCPFCGWCEISVKDALCVCSHCGATAPANIWNDRPREDYLENDIRELEKAIEKAKRYL